ncbi:hypothetical protein Tco_1157763 [Tanacetum coccineum]
MLPVSLDEIKVDKTLHFVEEPVENSDREVKRLKCSRMVVVKFLFDELRDRVVNDVVTQLKVLTSLLDDVRGKVVSCLGSTSGIRAFALRNFDETTQNNTTSQLPILKLENGNSWVSVPQTSQEEGTSVTKMSVPVTAEEKTNKKNDVKARSLLLMALPNEHQLTFSQYTDAKIMYAAIKTRFRGNEATKKTQKALLKQQYENFNASSLESLDSIFNRLQKLVSRLAILGVIITPEDLNSKFLRSLPPE